MMARKAFETIFDVTFCEPLTIEMSVFNDWMQGITVEDAAKRRHGNVKIPEGFSAMATQAGDADMHRLIYRDTVDQFRLFNQLQPCLEVPSLLIDNAQFDFSPEQVQVLVQQYYDLDDAVVRELMGKKLTQSLRKDMDDLAIQTRTPLFSVHRQFDNLKRVMKCVDRSELSPKHTIEYVVQSNFRISPDLAKKYVTVFSQSLYKINVAHKRLQFLTFADVHNIVTFLLDRWGKTYCAQFDQAFMQKVKELKPLLLEKTDTLEQYRLSIRCRTVNGEPLGLRDDDGAWDRMWERGLDKSFNTMMVNLIKIGANLSQPTEIRDVLIDLTEKVADPFLKAGAERGLVEEFFQIAIACFADLPLFKDKDRELYREQWQMFLHGVKTFLLYVYDKLSSNA